MDPTQFSLEVYIWKSNGSGSDGGRVNFDEESIERAGGLPQVEANYKCKHAFLN